MAKGVLEPVPRVRTLRDTAPDALEQVLTKALARSPADRFQSAGEIAQALSLPTGVAAPTGPPASRALLALGVKLICSTGTSSGFWQRPSCDDPPDADQDQRPARERSPD